MPRPPHPPASLVFRDPVHLLAFGFGSGLARWAPGTFGSAAALVLYFAIIGLPDWAYLGVVALVTVSGFWICGESARRLGVHDHPGIVWDEWAGMLITLAFAPAGLVWVLVGFLLFRFFDIVKPFPARYFDRHWHSGVGIVMDDVVAAIYAWLVLQALAWAVMTYL
ncbi:Phosphatidylglycerophosphatase A [Thioalkalivibrio nitratireducens DSM 14787]|uniref:Phosphatidylglycerophosphatase A n=1 Tax=Thioalkalivibrio nitratireducens (strain DSM 14787 / UNIQEM 213 / ALEN2) TaxID=1255043 RepID=L0DUL2_THIND|nr:phosphatidylglycerophosphatase A [Thioalkalivibrio nitratireducens]AGA32680.1 Phosphatidylglycerophosphatase A [Thioalkalivibrio nitratireducens DSM 14787]